MAHWQWRTYWLRCSHATHLGACCCKNACDGSLICGEVTTPARCTDYRVRILRKQAKQSPERQVGRVRPAHAAQCGNKTSGRVVILEQLPALVSMGELPRRAMQQWGGQQWKGQ